MQWALIAFKRYAVRLLALSVELGMEPNVLEADQIGSQKQ